MGRKWWVRPSSRPQRIAPDFDDPREHGQAKSSKGRGEEEALRPCAHRLARRREEGDGETEPQGAQVMGGGDRDGSERAHQRASRRRVAQERQERPKAGE